MKVFSLNRTDPQRPPSYSIDYATLLNEAQAKAVFHTGSPALVIAGAGTGKTRTLVYRVARLIESGVPPQQIVLLTFTRKSAKDMLERASELLDGRCRQVRGGTFHSFCHSLLQDHAEAIGFRKGFTVLDADDASDIIQFYRTELDVAKKDSLFPKKNTLLSIYSACVNRRESIESLIETRYPQFKSHIDTIRLIQTHVQAHKREQNQMDFDDLLTFTLELLSEHESIRMATSADIRHLMIDEFQDTNALQVELAECLTSVHKNLFAVGDDAQSIYGFRGADHRHIMEFPARFPGAVTITLEENYRSVQPVLNVANRLLTQAKQAYPKELKALKGTGDLPGIVKAPTQEDQSRFISQMILNLREQGISLDQTAVLFRNSRDSFDLELALNSRGIPYVKYGGTKLTEAAHVKDVLAHFKVVVNPADGVAWNRVLGLIEGIGPKTSRDFFEWMRTKGFEFDHGAQFPAGSTYKTQVLSLVSLLSDLKTKNYPTHEAFKHVVDYYTPLCRKRYEDHEKRLQDLQVLHDMSRSFRSMSRMITELSLDPLDATAVDVVGMEAMEQPLVLSTIHSAKGLEWSVVFVMQCLDGVLPSSYAVDDESQLDEELRLMYVATTRAKEHLFFTYPAIAHSATGEFFTKPSRFLSVMDETLLEPWILVEEPENLLPPPQLES
jgi:DNA helicase-2/ATP-dependent DNA helicase PcrA